MQSRKDQVQAYFFVVGRMVSAVTHGRPDPLVAPNRRLSMGIVIGVLVAGLMVGVFGIVGLFFPGGSDAWRTPGALVLDEDSGARYVNLGGQLRPVLNLASARLATGAATPPVVVGRDSMASAGVGQPLGIPGAPDSLPDPARLDRGPWGACTVASSAGPSTTLLFARAPAPALTAEQALLVATPDGARYLLWNGARHRAGPPALQVLGYGSTPAVPVSSMWLAGLPAGRDVAVPDTPGVGTPGPSVAGRPARVGQVLAVQNPALTTQQLYLLRGDGLAPLTPTAAALLLASPITAVAYGGLPATPIPVGPAALAGLPISRGPDLSAGLPASPPPSAGLPAGAVPCVRFGSAAAPAALELRPASQVLVNATPTPRHLAGTAADRVTIPAGGGALVREAPTPGGPPGALFLITDVGMRFPLADDDAATRLGYVPATAVPAPPELLAMLPVGPVLSTGAAVTEQSP